MPSPSKIDLLQAQAPEVYEELNRRLVGSAFGNSVGLSEWLKSVGWDIGKTTVNEYAQELREKIERRRERALMRVEIHKALGGMDDDQKAALMEVGEMAAYDAYLDLLDEMADAPREERAKYLPKLLDAGSRMGGSVRDTAKFKAEIKAQAQAEERAKAAEVVAIVAKKGGMLKETAEELRREILGMAA